MNFPGVIQGLPAVLDKLDIFSGLPQDGHAPALSGNELNAYIAAGLQTDHECSSLAEAREKLARGMRVLIREGGMARNMDRLQGQVQVPGSRFRVDQRFNILTI